MGGFTSGELAVEWHPEALYRQPVQLSLGTVLGILAVDEASQVQAPAAEALTGLPQLEPLSVPVVLPVPHGTQDTPQTELKRLGALPPGAA